MAKEICRESCKLWPLRLAAIVLSFWFVVALNFQAFGDGLDFCFDGSKEGGLRYTENIYICEQRSLIKKKNLDLEKKEASSQN
jgi:hypothetical protein